MARPPAQSALVQDRTPLQSPYLAPAWRPRLCGDGAGHLALGTPFSTLTLNEGYSYVALDNLIGGLYIEDEAEVRAYADTWSKLAAVALPFEHSAE